MKLLLKTEYLFLLSIGVYAFHETGQSWWLFAALFFTPDISMLGYLVNNKVGAWIYNFFHHFGLGIIIYFIGKFIDLQWLEIAGIILFCHTSFDRFFGYGLKHADSFQHTHLGVIGKKQNINHGIK